MVHAFTNIHTCACKTHTHTQQSLKSARSVKYEERGGVPGLLVQKGCTMSSRKWSAIAPSPVATRTRTIMCKFIVSCLSHRSNLACCPWGVTLKVYLSIYQQEHGSSHLCPQSPARPLSPHVYPRPYCLQEQGHLCSTHEYRDQLQHSNGTCTCTYACMFVSTCMGSWWNPLVRMCDPLHALFMVQYFAGVFLVR